MATITLLKDDGIFTYDDYLRGRAALRIKELNDTNPSQNIRRKTADTDIQAVLVSRSWWDAREAAYAAVDAPTFAYAAEIRDDDYMGSNLALMIDLINGEAKVPGQVSRVIADGITGDAYKTYSLVEKKGFWVDDSTAIPFEESQKIGGEPVAYLIHYAQYQSLSATPVLAIVVPRSLS